METRTTAERIDAAHAAAELLAALTAYQKQWPGDSDTITATRQAFRSMVSLVIVAG